MVGNYRLQATNIYPNYKPFTNQETNPHGPSKSENGMTM